MIPLKRLYPTGLLLTVPVGCRIVHQTINDVNTPLRHRLISDVSGVVSSSHTCYIINIIPSFPLLLPVSTWGEGDGDSNDKAAVPCYCYISAAIHLDYGVLA